MSFDVGNRQSSCAPARTISSPNEPQPWWAMFPIWKMMRNAPPRTCFVLPNHQNDPTPRTVELWKDTAHRGELPNQIKPDERLTTQQGSSFARSLSFSRSCCKQCAAEKAQGVMRAKPYVSADHARQSVRIINRSCYETAAEARSTHPFGSIPACVRVCVFWCGGEWGR